MGFTSLGFVLLELLIDGSDSVQQHLDLLHTGETRSASHNQTHLDTHTYTSVHVQVLLPVLGVRSHLLRPAVSQQTSREELCFDVLSGSFHWLQ